MTGWVRGRGCAAARGGVPLALRGKTPADTAKPYPLPPLTVSVTRTELPLTKVPLSVHTVDRAQISRAKPTWGLDEALANVPGVFVANRYNFSQDQRISIRGFGARSAFAVRGIKILVDGIPQTLPDGQGQLTNLELGEVDRIEVLRGSSSRSEEHTSELQSPCNLVCRLLLEKKKQTDTTLWYKLERTRVIHSN